MFKKKNLRSVINNITRKVRQLYFFSLLSFLIMSPTMAGWEVNYIDTFSGNGINWQNWTAQTDANFNNEVQCYTDDDSSVNKNFDVSNGTLKIIARKQQVSCTGLNNQTRSWTTILSVSVSPLIYAKGITCTTPAFLRTSNLCLPIICSIL